MFCNLAFGQYYSGKEEITLEEDSETLQTITVISDRPDYEKILSPGTVSWIEPEEFTGEQKDIPTLLERVPGVMVRRQGTGQYAYATIRGSTGSQVSVYVDGIPLNSSGTQTVDISMIPVTEVVRIEVYRGYIPVRFSASPIGGVINIVTKKPETYNLQLEAGARSFGGMTGKFSLTTPVISGALLLSGSHDRATGRFKYWYPGRPTAIPQSSATQGGNRYRLNNSFQSNNFLLKWQNDNWNFRVSWDETERFIPEAIDQGAAPDIDYVDTGADRNYRNSNRYLKEINKIFSVGWTDSFWDKLSFNLRLDYIDNDRHFENRSPYFATVNQNLYNIFPGEIWSNYITKRLNSVADVSYKINPFILLEFHFDFSDEDFRVNGNKWMYYNMSNLVNWELQPKYTLKSWHLQLQSTFTLDKSNSFWLTLIGRAEKVQGGEESTRGKTGYPESQWMKSWGAALKKEFKSIGLTAQATYGTFYRYPSFYEIYGDGVWVRPPANTIAPGNFYRPSWEHGTQWDIGLSWRGHFIGADNYLAITYFNRTTHDLIGFVSTPSMWVIYQNLGLGKSSGLELEGNFSWPRVNLFISATYMDAYLADVSSNFKTQTAQLTEGPMLNQPKYEYLVRGDYTIPWLDNRLKVFIEYKFLDKIPFIAFRDSHNWLNMVKYENKLTLTNLGFKLNVFRTLNVSVGVNDLFNEGPNQGVTVQNLGVKPTTHIDIVRYPQQGRTWYSTLSYNF
jgi:outer membrane receptor protein involved in Fe transport